MGKEEARKEIKKLIEDYTLKKSQGKIRVTDEEQIKQHYIEPLFEILGWNMRDLEEVIKEEKVGRKKVDFAFKVNGVTRFFIEAKAVNIDLTDKKVLEQALNYGWNKGITWTVLTNFETFFILNCQWKVTGHLLMSSYKSLHYDKLADAQFDTLWLLSKESFAQGELDELAEGEERKAKRTPVTSQLFQDLTKMRNLLRADIIRHNPSLKDKPSVIGEVIQRIIDKLIFIRKAEDLDIEDFPLKNAARLYESGELKHLWKKVQSIFLDFDNTYNSEMFRADHESNKVDVGDNAVFQAVTMLYSPDERYEYNFAYIDADVLGNIYEQYLALLLKGGDIRGKLEESKVHRKEQGTYYTPTYIVDYIVKNTIGEWLKDKKNDTAKIKVLDPACGSGSFLIRTVDYLYNERVKNDGKEYQSQLADGRKARTTLKSEIIKENIFGVDLDGKAVDIAQLNLLLKAAETKQKLPTLRSNIKIGNSLIDDPTIAGDKAFIWKNEFKHIIDEGRFDVIIGNPPYISMERMKELQPYFEKNYPEVFVGKSDILYYFMAKSIELLKEGGYFGMIVSRYFMDANFGEKIREYILKNCSIKQIVDFRNVQVFDGANVLTSIIIFQKKRLPKNIDVVIFKDNCKNPGSVLTQLNNKKTAVLGDIDHFILEQKSLDKNPWLFEKPEGKEILTKILKKAKPLGDLCDIGQGMQTGLNEVFVVTPEILQKYHIEKELIRKRIKNGDLRKFEINFSPEKDRWLIYTEMIDDIGSYPHAKKYLLEFEKGLKARANYKLGNCEWFKFTCPLNKEIFESEKEKVLVPFMATENRFAYDKGGKEGSYFGLTDTSVLRVKEGVNVPTKYLVGILNSKLLEFVHHRMSKLKRDGYYEYFSKTLAPLPVIIDKNYFARISKYVEEISALREKINDSKNTDQNDVLVEKAVILENDADNEVYTLYGITKEEKEIIKGGLK